MSESSTAVAETLVSDYFNEFGARGDRRLVRVAQHPMSLVRTWRAIAHLPLLEAGLGSSDEAHIVRMGLRRGSALARTSVRGTTAVLAIPADGAEYLSGPGESNRSLRTKVRRAERQGFTMSTPTSRNERLELLRLCEAYERAHPNPRYRTASPDLDDLLNVRTWLVARDANGRPLLVAVLPVDGEWAVLRHFRTLEDSDAARLARPWLSALMVRHLSDIGVRYLADTSSPVGLPSGLRSFQRQLGYRLRRVRIGTTPIPLADRAYGGGSRADAAHSPRQQPARGANRKLPIEVTQLHEPVTAGR